MEELVLTVTRAAKLLGDCRATLSALVYCRASLAPELELRNRKAFDVNMHMLLRMQAWHDAMRRRPL